MIIISNNTMEIINDNQSRIFDTVNENGILDRFGFGHRVRDGLGQREKEAE